MSAPLDSRPSAPLPAEAAPAAPVAAASAAGGPAAREPDSDARQGDDGAATAGSASAPAHPPRRQRPPRSVTQYTYTVRQQPDEIPRLIGGQQSPQSRQQQAQPTAAADPYSADWRAALRRDALLRSRSRFEPPPPQPAHQGHARKAEVVFQSNTAVGAFTALTMGIVVMLIGGGAMGSDLLRLTGAQSAKLTVTDSRQRVTFWGVERCQMIGLRVDYCEAHSLSRARDLDELSRDCPKFVRGAAGCITIALLLCLVVTAMSVAEWARKFHDVVWGSEGWTRFVRALFVALACLFTILPVIIMDDALDSNACFDLQVSPAEEYKAGPARTLCILAFVFALFPLVAEALRVIALCPGAPDVAWQVRQERKAARLCLEEAKRSQDRHRKVVEHVVAPTPPPPLVAAGGGPTVATVVDGSRAAVGPVTPRGNSRGASDDDDDDASDTPVAAAAPDGDDSHVGVHVPEDLLIADDEVDTDAVPAAVRAEGVFVMTCSAFIGIIAIACLSSRVDVHKGGTLRIGRFIDPNPNDFQLYFFSTDECAPGVDCEHRTLEHVTSKECSHTMCATAATLSIAIIAFAVAFGTAARTISGAAAWAYANRLATPWALITACAALYTGFGILEAGAARYYCLPFFLNGSRDGPAWPCLVTCLVLTPILCLCSALPKLVRVQWMSGYTAADYRAQRKAERRAARAAKLAAKEREMSAKKERVPQKAATGADESSRAARADDDDAAEGDAMISNGPRDANGSMKPSTHEPRVAGAATECTDRSPLPPRCAHMSPSAASDGAAAD